MENIDLINMWKQYDEKLSKTLSLNKKIVLELQQQKAKKALRPAKRAKYVTVLIGIIYIAMVAAFGYKIFPHANVFLLGSVALHLLVCIIAVLMYIRQLVLIHEIDNSENIMLMQQKLAKLQTSTIKIIALCFLQLPVFSTWNITWKMINEMPLNFWLIQMPIVLLFTLAGIWLYKNVDPKNMDKKWFKIMFCGAEWSSMIRSGKLLKEIEQFDEEN